MAHWSHYNPGYDPRIPPLSLHLPQALPTVQYQSIPYGVSPPMATRHRADPQPYPQSTGGAPLTEHLNRVVASSHQALLERISRQDEILARQQDLLDSVSRLLAAGRNESMKENETIRIQLHDIEKRTDRLTNAIGDSMKLLAAGTIKAITDCQTTIEKRLFCVEESCEGLKEEIRDPHANIPEDVHHEVGIGLDSPTQTTSYCDATATPPSPSRLPGPSFDPRVPYDGGERNLDSRQHSNNNDLRAPSETHGVRSSCEPSANGTEFPEPRSSFEQLSYYTVDPMDTLHVPGPSRTLSSSLNIDLDGPLDAEPYEQPSSSVTHCHEESLSGALSPSLFSNPSRCHSRPPIAALGSHSLLHSPETTTSSMQVHNAIVPGREDAHESRLSSARSSRSPAPLDSALGSPYASTTSLPEPSALLDELFSQPRDKKLQVTGSPSFAFQSRPIGRAWSLSSLSSIPSVDVPIALNQISSSPAPSNCDEKGANSRASTSSRKRRRSSPGPKRGKAAKKPKSGVAKKMEKDLTVEYGASSVTRNKSSAPPAPSAQSSLSFPSVSNTSRQFIQCDKCRLWYHWGCVNIRDDDPRLKDDEIFACPPCQNDKTPTAPSSSQKAQGDICSWIDCDLGGDAAEEFFIEKLIGRYDRKQRGINRFLWLVKWEGYPAEEATWTPRRELTNPEKLIKEFGLAAKAEGIVLSRSTVNLLQEAVKSGWADGQV